MYYIYEVFGVKIGCTTDPVRRVEKQQGFSSEEYTILESHIDLHRASERERELQLEKGYRVDQDTYYEVLKKQKLASSEIYRLKAGKSYSTSQKGKKRDWLNTPEVIKKRVQTIDYKEVSKKRIQKLKGKSNEKAKKPVHQFDLNGNFLKLWPSIKEAGKVYGESSVSHTIRGLQKTGKGFIWKYA